MANLALLVDPDEGLAWARRAAAAVPFSAHAQRTLGKLALATSHADEAAVAFARAVEVEPGYAGNHYNLALALIATGHSDEARAELAACAHDPELAQRVAAQLARIAGESP
jgi:predicted Zn-dependent protease